MSDLKIGNINVKFPKENPYKVQVKFMEKVLETLKKPSQNAILEGPTGMGKTLCLLSSVLAWKNAVEPKVRIFYCSRTVNQINNVVEELKKLSAYYKINVAVLSSKKNYCVNPELGQMNSFDDVNQFCSERLFGKPTDVIGIAENEEPKQLNASFKPCPYYYEDDKESKKNFEHYKKFFFETVKTTNENRAWGKAFKLCPYYQNINLEPDADVICLNYNYLLKKNIKVDINKAILIMDEAHNIDQVCEDNYSKKWSEGFLKKIKRFLWLLSNLKYQSATNDGNEEIITWSSQGLDFLVTIAYCDFLAKIFAKFKEKLIFLNETENDEEKLFENFIKLDFKTLQNEFDLLTEGDIYNVYLSERKKASNSEFFTAFFSRKFALDFEEGEQETFEESELKIKNFEDCTPEKYYKKFPNEKDYFLEKYMKSRKYPILKVFESIKKVADDSHLLEEKYSQMWRFYSLVKSINEICNKVKKEHYAHFRMIFKLNPKSIDNNKESDPLDQDFNKTLSNNQILKNCIRSLNGKKLPPQNNRKEPKNRMKTKNCKVVLLFVCLSPHIAFKDLRTKGVRNIILTSGTLSPFEQVESQLGFRFDIKKSFKPVADTKRNFFSGIVTCLKKSQPFKLVRPKDNAVEIYEEMLENVGKSVFEIVSITPHGVLIFFASYRVYMDCLKAWSSCYIFEKLNKKKYIVMEEPNVDLTARMKEFEEKAKTQQGALLLGVCGGRMSEGFNFSDELARAVIIIGIPLKSLGDYKVKLKMEYLDQRTDTTFKGKKWYNIQAIRSVNQAVGRVLRHSLDWGAAFLMDYRMTEHNPLLSRWIKEQITAGKLDEVLNNLGDFFERSRVTSNENYNASYTKLLEELMEEGLLDEECDPPKKDIDSELEYDFDMIDDEINKHLISREQVHHSQTAENINPKVEWDLSQFDKNEGNIGNQPKERKDRDDRDDRNDKNDKEGQLSIQEAPLVIKIEHTGEHLINFDQSDNLIEFEVNKKADIINRPPEEEVNEDPNQVNDRNGINKCNKFEQEFNLAQAESKNREEFETCSENLSVFELDENNMSVDKLNSIEGTHCGISFEDDLIGKVVSKENIEKMKPILSDLDFETSIKEEDDGVKDKYTSFGASLERFRKDNKEMHFNGDNKEVHFNDNRDVHFDEKIPENKNENLFSVKMEIEEN